MKKAFKLNLKIDKLIKSQQINNLKVWLTKNACRLHSRSLPFAFCLPQKTRLIDY